jgi:transcriptional antiterminator RfaH
MDSNTRQWFAVQSKPHQEEKAKINLENQDFTVYLPKIQVRTKIRGRWQELLEPLFLNYLFIQVDPSHESLATVRSTIGVLRLVRFGNVLQPVPDGIIEFLQMREDTLLGARPLAKNQFKPGDKLQIIEGPFRGLEAIYQMQQSEERFWVLVSVLGALSKVQLHKDNLAAVSS